MPFGLDVGRKDSLRVVVSGVNAEIWAAYTASDHDMPTWLPIVSHCLLQV